MSCANTSLPWFIEPPRAMLPGRAAKPKFEIQIETKKINRLCVFHQQLTGAENPNVGTLLKRTDIWAFGCVLYELLAGRQAFQGETTTEILAALLRGEPDWQALPQTPPFRCRGLLWRCLE